MQHNTIWRYQTTIRQFFIFTNQTLVCSTFILATNQNDHSQFDLESVVLFDFNITDLTSNVYLYITDNGCIK